MTNYKIVADSYCSNVPYSSSVYSPNAVYISKQSSKKSYCCGRFRSGNPCGSCPNQ